MARTTAEDVKAILDNSQLSDPEVVVFIDSANTFMADVFSSTTLSTAILTEIEKWLAAHLISITKERTASQEKLGDASIQYTGKFGKSLESTSYGQMVLMLDTSGALANTGKRQASIIAIQSFE